MPTTSATRDRATSMVSKKKKVNPSQPGMGRKRRDSFWREWRLPPQWLAQWGTRDADVARPPVVVTAAPHRARAFRTVHRPQASSALSTALKPAALSTDRVPASLVASLVPVALHHHRSSPSLGCYRGPYRQ